MNWTQRKELFKTTFLEFTKERSLMHGAALSYYSMLALIPILYLSITYVGMLVGNEVIVEIISSLLREYVGIKDTSGIMEFLNEVDFEKGSLTMQIIGFLALMFSCSAIFNSIRRSLNTFYSISTKEIPRSKLIIRGLIARLVSMLFVFGATLLFVILYFFETVFLSLSNEFFSDMEIVNRLLLNTLNYGFPILTNIIVFSFIFKFMHDGRVQWKMALRGAVLTSVLLYLGQLLIKYYLTNYFFAANGGVVGTMLVLLVWVYYSSQIIFLGAKFISVLSRMTGNPIVHRERGD
ncbi:MAG: YihY/virulence factor BrkB family protein [Crocinitomicaceae bacterium]|nr:YihY/virulence factor BrkB family protein [Crocinitomicaceae bacterium]